MQGTAHTSDTTTAKVIAGGLSSAESVKIFGVPLTRRGIRAVYLQVMNQHTAPLRLFALEIDPHYYTPIEAAGLNHFSVLKRLSTFGLAAWFFLPLLVLLPGKLIAAAIANRRVDDCFRQLAFPLRPIKPGETVAGFIYTNLDAGNETVRVCLYATENPPSPDAHEHAPERAHAPIVDLTFLIPVPGVAIDAAHRRLAEQATNSDPIHCDLPQLIERLRELPATTTNATDTGHGDPVNLCVIGDYDTILSACTARWDECETISLDTCWKTMRAFLLGSEYRYSPVSPLYLFGRSQDLALQKIRHSINERLHLRLWLTTWRFAGRPVWVGQISRDIGVRFTTKTWNLTTHRIDPDVDESRDYLAEDLLRAERIEAVGYVAHEPPSTVKAPQTNLTGDVYFSDGKRLVIVLSKSRCSPRYVAWT